MSTEQKALLKLTIYFLNLTLIMLLCACQKNYLTTHCRNHIITLSNTRNNDITVFALTVNSAQVECSGFNEVLFPDQTKPYEIVLYEMLIISIRILFMT